jgi:TetR/AcrR family transcriptional repressor of mexJK operon
VADGRTALKRQAILDAARGVFLQHGYAGTTMDQVASYAGASKVTVYSHFADKQRLFLAVAEDAIAEAEAGTASLVERLGATEDLEGDLRTFARRHLREVTSPHLIAIRRLIIAEAHRFPELARGWHRGAPERARATLAVQLRRLDERRLLAVPDPPLAAASLNYLILSALVNEAMFTVRTTPFDRRTVHRYADEAVRIFLAAYAAGATGGARAPS